jgi:hypothetical protein
MSARGWVRRGVAATVLAAVLAVAGGSEAIAEPDPGELVLDGLLGAAASQLSPRECPELTGGTAGVPERTTPPGQLVPDRGNGLGRGDPTSAPASLPRAIYLRSTRATYNRRYWFIVHGGHIYFKSNAEVTGIRQPWAPLSTPGCFDGKVAGISVDDDELLAVDSNRQIFTMDGALGDPSFFNWTVRWGPSFWTGAGRTLPHGQTWSWSVSSPREDGTFTDPAGNEHTVGDAKVSHVWLLSHHGQWLTYMDPWLPRDESYEMCGPRRGRFRAVDMSASGSTQFVINRFGDMFTRLYDFDISGPDSFFLNYSYYDQRGVANPAIQLPPERWTRQPKIPGRIRSAISIEKQGLGSIHRILRVEGRRHGTTGYWQRDIAAPAAKGWRFVKTGAKLTGRPLANPARDTSGRGLGPSENGHYAMHGPGLTGRIPDFNVYCSPARLHMRLDDGSKVALTLHTTDDIRQTPRARGLDSSPRRISGTIEAGRKVLRSHDPDVQAFAASYLDGRFTDAPIDATTDSLQFSTQGWTFAKNLSR